MFKEYIFEWWKFKGRRNLYRGPWRGTLVSQIEGMRRKCAQRKGGINAQRRKYDSKRNIVGSTKSLWNISFPHIASYSISKSKNKNNRPPSPHPRPGPRHLNLIKSLTYIIPGGVRRHKLHTQR